jgi:hypothetical protein
MWSKLDGPQVCLHANRKYSLPNHVLCKALSFSGVKFETLTRLKKIVVRSSWTQTRATATDILGMAEHWSSEGLHANVNVLRYLATKAVV